MRAISLLSAFFILSAIFIVYGADYDEGARRGPFVPLADENGMRRNLSQSGAEGELPVKLQIMGILASEGSAMAIINGEVVKEGDSIGDVKIEKIDEKSVSVNYQNKIYKLMLREEEEGTEIAK